VGGGELDGLGEGRGAEAFDDRADGVLHRLWPCRDAGLYARVEDCLTIIAPAVQRTGQWAFWNRSSQGNTFAEPS